MVHVDLEPSNDARLRVAADLALRFGSHVIGIAAGNPNPPAYGGGKFAAGLIAQQRATIEVQLTAAEDRFRAAMGRGISHPEWRQALEKPNAYVAAQARAADLIIAGNGHYGGVLDPFRTLDPSLLVMEAGRPVLIVPAEVESCQAKKVVIGWKNTREARRAIWDALPLLRAAEYVVVGEILDVEEQAAADTRLGDVIRWLGRHEVTAVPRIMRGVGDTAELLQQMAAEEFADLIVTGAYGHSRLGEWIWGGVTETLLTSAQMCCLLAH
jgi:nucleotide-binding universal stress UspA family protein